jgi:ABC-2 type transport system permease protein
MAVYDQGYKPYEGELTPAWSRFLVIPRYAYQDLFKYKLFIVLFALSFVWPLVSAILIYLRHNANALAALNLPLSDVVPINGLFFYIFTNIQTSLAFIFTVIIGPVLISRDLSNNALPLYLSRPFSRFEYIVGKMSVLLILLSAFTWVPGLLLFLLQSYLAGGEWMTDNLWIAGAVFTLSLAALTILSLLAMAFSAWIKWRTAASAALFAIFIIPQPIGFVIYNILHTDKGFLINLGVAYGALAAHMFRLNWISILLSPAEAWSVTIGYAAIALFMLTRRIKAYEVVS